MKNSPRRVQRDFFIIIKQMVWTLLGYLLLWFWSGDAEGAEKWVLEELPGVLDGKKFPAILLIGEY